MYFFSCCRCTQAHTHRNDNETKADYIDLWHRSVAASRAYVVIIPYLAHTRHGRRTQTIDFVVVVFATVATQSRTLRRTIFFFKTIFIRFHKMSASWMGKKRSARIFCEWILKMLKIAMPRPQSTVRIPSHPSRYRCQRPAIIHKWLTSHAVNHMYVEGIIYTQRASATYPRKYI